MDLYLPTTDLPRWGEAQSPLASFLKTPNSDFFLKNRYCIWNQQNLYIKLATQKRLTFFGSTYTLYDYMRCNQFSLSEVYPYQKPFGIIILPYLSIVYYIRIYCHHYYYIILLHSEFWHSLFLKCFRQAKNMSVNGFLCWQTLSSGKTFLVISCTTHLIYIFWKLMMIQIPILRLKRWTVFGTQKSLAF